MSPVELSLGKIKLVVFLIVRAEVVLGSRGTRVFLNYISPKCFTRFPNGCSVVALISEEDQPAAGNQQQRRPVI